MRLGDDAIGKETEKRRGVHDALSSSRDFAVCGPSTGSEIAKTCLCSRH